MDSARANVRAASAIVALVERVALKRAVGAVPRVGHVHVAVHRGNHGVAFIVLAHSGKGFDSLRQLLARVVVAVKGVVIVRGHFRLPKVSLPLDVARRRKAVGIGLRLRASRILFVHVLVDRKRGPILVYIPAPALQRHHVPLQRCGVGVVHLAVLGRRHGAQLAPDGTRRRRRRGWRHWWVGRRRRGRRVAHVGIGERCQQHGRRHNVGAVLFGSAAQLLPIQVKFSPPQTNVAAAAVARVLGRRVHRRRLDVVVHKGVKVPKVEHEACIVVKRAPELGVHLGPHAQKEPTATKARARRAGCLRVGVDEPHGMRGHESVRAHDDVALVEGCIVRHVHGNEHLRIGIAALGRRAKARKAAHRFQVPRV